MVGEDTFYEAAGQRDSRFATLVRQVALADLDWLTRFARWLRTDANMRSASLVLAAEAAKASVDAGQTGSRAAVDAVLQRADEPGEMLSYWISHYGKSIPKPVKRGVADAAARLYNEKSYLKWDSGSRGVRFADVIQLAHVDPRGEWQSALFKYAIENRLGVEGLELPARLETLCANADLRGTDAATINRWAREGLLADKLAFAGMTWEAVPSLVNGAWTRELWESIIPSMGLMALTRNLRNFDQASVSDEVAAKVAARLSDPEQVARSRQFPFRFYAAHKNVGSLRWGHVLETAVKHSLANVPALPGRTLVLVDQSPSMFPGTYYSGNASKSDIVFAEKAALFGTALALRAEHADLYGYGFKSYRVGFGKGDAVLRTMQKFHQENGTDTLGVLQARFDNHDRVVIVTDEQTTSIDPHWRSYYGLPAVRPIDQLVPKHVNIYSWNIAGYEHGHGGGPNWHGFGGLTDRGFDMIPLLERGRDARWPWDEQAR
ncbi:TROVE domain-containing protein [Nocardia tengchongensis]|uniref:TROVE domain-containing protein n=1 Tax=Nocardia tengchongensis TaxID=2055889 RepID=UPI0036A955C9